jgi:CubicO group peptidase (beta-lactamase class C family)
MFGWAASIAALCAACAPRADDALPWRHDPLPQSIAEVESAARRVLQETAVPGAGLALVTSAGVEWLGAFGYADREARTPVTADTHFRVGSISKTFAAMALVQLYEDGTIDLHAPVAEIAPEIDIDNPWHADEPVRVIHLLQHTAGFDDMRVTDGYVRDGAPELSLGEVLRLNPGSRRVRWRPGTRMAYSNVGYGLAGFLVEKVTDESFETYVRREIFDPLEMKTSAFRIAPEDEATLARGYVDEAGPAVGFPRLHLRPAVGLHASTRELAQFVRMLLGWGELGTAFVVDPEYLSNMELPQTTLAANAGLRAGYGSGISTMLTLPYRALGHAGGVDGFSAMYGYSSSRDVGFVALVNSSAPRAREATTRLAALALRYLKRDVEPPAKPQIDLDAAALDRFTGFYQDVSPRRVLTAAVDRLFSGRAIEREGAVLVERTLAGQTTRLIPVTESAFRAEDELDASRIFISTDEGATVLTGIDIYAEPTPRWRVEIVRAPLLASLAILASLAMALPVWLVRAGRARPHGFWALKLALVGCGAAPALAVLALMSAPPRSWNVANMVTVTVWAAGVALPLLAATAAVLTARAITRGARRSLAVYAVLVVAAAASVSAYLGAYDLLGFRLWRY